MPFYQRKRRLLSNFNNRDLGIDSVSHFDIDSDSYMDSKSEFSDEEYIPELKYHEKQITLNKSLSNQVLFILN